MNKLNLKVLIILIIGFIVLGETLYLLKQNGLSSFFKTAPVSSNLAVSQSKKYWADQIAQLGAQKAYEKFKNENSLSKTAAQHQLAHIFGEQLYQREGLNGITICDQSFSFGCYHSFFGSAIADKGTNIIKDLDRICVKKYDPLGTGCQHGIGHGILEYTGHNKLDKALNLCKPIQRLTYLGCEAGVFMEYNFPTLIDSKIAITESRKLNPNNFLEPCDTLDKSYRASCYFELTQLWAQQFKDSRKLGQLCSQILDASESCYLGIGNLVAPQTDYNLSKAMTECSQMPDKNSTALCMAGVSWGFFAMNKPDSKIACDKLDTNLKNLCLAKADLTKE